MHAPGDIEGGEERREGGGLLTNNIKSRRKSGLQTKTANEIPHADLAGECANFAIHRTKQNRFPARAGFIYRDRNRF